MANNDWRSLLGAFSEVISVPSQQTCTQNRGHAVRFRQFVAARSRMGKGGSCNRIITYKTTLPITYFQTDTHVLPSLVPFAYAAGPSSSRTACRNTCTNITRCGNDRRSPSACRSVRKFQTLPDDDHDNAPHGTITVRVTHSKHKTC